ncbi:MAG: hypothetical protein ACPGR8_15635 [Limisphaerales bacterium]|jgi:hypothetical protein|nr:hypothetical protein [Verrucomicrobiales bacterium]MDP6337521.1 hypothetical protein [Verrucomicrobiota bacterium]HBT22424.1 hypothetical protein [Verrucomicrobiales bacterium]HBV30880.1 hypothetical protein [Verrucomicrobiales bacterium]|tara:strand:+ start:283 stop:483 length:201 start_codon:yes stop_codon:yes gene_type:complete
MNSQKVEQRMERWLAKADSHPLAKRVADLALLLEDDAGAWERYGQFYEGWSREEIAVLLEAVKKAL